MTRSAARRSRRWMLWVLAVLAMACAPAVFAAFTVSLLNDIGMGSLVAVGLVLLTGIGGATSFGQAAFVGIAAYATAWLTSVYGLSPWLGLLFGLALTGAAALAIGLLTLRLGGHFLPLSTIAWGLCTPLLFGNMDALGRFTGLSEIPPLTIGAWALADPRSMFYVIWIAVGASWLFSANVLDSRPGRAMRGLRGGSVLLASVGADAFRFRLILFVMAALLAGLAGWLYAHTYRFVSPSPFNVEAGIQYLLMAVVGGIGQLGGAVAGAAVVWLLRDALQDALPLVTQYSAQIENLVFAALFVALLQQARGGVMGFAARWRRGQAVPAAAEAPAEPLPRRPLPTAGQPVLSVEGAAKRFGGLLAVNNVSFDVRAGELVGLIGPNGAGKSTMFNLLTGTLRLDAGRVRFLGRDITGMPQRRIARLGVARTFQHVKLRPQMSLLDNVALGAHARTTAGVIAAGLRLDRREERQIMAEARTQLARIGLADRAHELAGSLPLGTQRVLEVARALAADPVLLVLDEPAAGLRRKEKDALAALLRQLRGDGLTILIVEHDMDFVMKLVDRLVVMSFGSKLAEGPPAAVRADARVQAAYLGEVIDGAAARDAAPLAAEGGRA